jgi:hypothetical protein
MSFFDAPVREAWPLVKALLADPRSRLHAEFAGWDRPSSYESFALYDLIDILRQKWMKRHLYKPYPRPWPKAKTTLGGRNKRRSMREVVALLRNRDDQDPPA